MKINLYKTVFGSEPEFKGETNLYYTEGVSSFAQNICKIYQDNDRQLNPEHATFLLQYSPVDDRYVFAHIQAQVWVFEHGARMYPFRGAYELSREDYSRLPVTSIVNALPRLLPEEGRKGVVPHEAEIEPSAADFSEQEKNLASHINRAVQEGRFLYVSIPQDQLGDAKGNLLFTNPCFRILLNAIDCLATDVKEVATFSFLADSHYAFYLKESAVNIYAEGELVEFPDNVIRLTWDEAVSTPDSMDAVQEHTVLTEGQYISEILETNYATARISESIRGLKTSVADDNTIIALEQAIGKYNLWSADIFTDVWAIWRNAGKANLETLLNMVQRNQGISTNPAIIKSVYDFSNADNWQECCSLGDSKLQDYLFDLLGNIEDGSLVTELRQLYKKKRRQGRKRYLVLALTFLAGMIIGSGITLGVLYAMHLIP